MPEGYDSGAAPGGSEWLPTLEYSNVWDFIENVSINKGSHAYKMGFEYRPIEFPFFQVPSPRGTFDSSGTARNPLSFREERAMASQDGFSATRVIAGSLHRTLFLQTRRHTPGFSRMTGS